MMEQGEIETSPDLHHSPDIEILPDDEIDLTLEERRRASDREDNEESLHIKPPQVHVSKRDKHKHKHKDDRKKDRERERDRSRHGERDKDRGKHKDRRGDKDKMPKETHEERLLREAREREREHDRERYRRKEQEAEAKRREKSQRERDRLERLERERRKLEREREQREMEHRERLKQEQDRQERIAKVEREQERLAKAEREQERLAEAERHFAKEMERKVVEHVVKSDRHRGSSERDYEKERSRRSRGGGDEEGRKAHSTRHELERRRDKERGSSSRADKKDPRDRSRSPYTSSKKEASRGQHQYGGRSHEQQRYHRHRKEDPMEQEDLDQELERTYNAQQVTMDTRDPRDHHIGAVEAESEGESSSGSDSDSESEDSESDSQSEVSADSPRSHHESRSHSEGEISPHEHPRHVKSKFDDDDEHQDYEDSYHRRHHRRRQHSHDADNNEPYEENDPDSLPPSRPHSDEEAEIPDHQDLRESDYAASTPPQSPPELAPPRLPPYLPAIQGCRNVEEFHCLNRIEEGTYGVVYRARDNKTGELVALKRLKMEKEKEGFPITSLREINTLLKAQHPNIVTVREIVVGSNMDKIYIVMDYVEHDLKSLMQTMKDPFTIGEVKTLMQQLLRGVAHLHDNWIIHRDLKTSNLLLSHNAILKIGDFGLAREYGSPLKPYTSIVVTLWYRSPELLLGIKEYSTYIDMWSVGCIFAEFLTMKPLFPGKSEIDQLNRIFKELGTPNEKIWEGVSELPVMKKCTFAEYPYNQLRKRFSSHLSDRGFDLMNRFLTYDPQRRLTAKDALDHDHFVESPLPVSPSMFPTWPAKSEQSSRTHANTPRPPSGGKAYDKLLGDDDEALTAGFHIGSSAKGSAALGFKLKF